MSFFIQRINKTFLQTVILHNSILYVDKRSNIDIQLMTEKTDVLSNLTSVNQRNLDLSILTDLYNIVTFDYKKKI
jgi:hypothetical protein